jgi:elongation factor 1-beta
MGDVIVVFKIIPEEIEFFQPLKKELEKLRPQRLEEEPIAFGIKAWKFTKFVPDEEGALPALEEKLAKIKGVQTVDTVEISRSL